MSLVGPIFNNFVFKKKFISTLIITILSHHNYVPHLEYDFPHWFEGQCHGSISKKFTKILPVHDLLEKWYLDRWVWQNSNKNNYTPELFYCVNKKKSINMVKTARMYRCFLINILSIFNFFNVFEFISWAFWILL